MSEWDTSLWEETKKKQQQQKHSTFTIIINNKSNTKSARDEDATVLARAIART